jgi:hypothetical protein
MAKRCWPLVVLAVTLAPRVGAQVTRQVSPGESIQEAVNRAAPGDIIELGAGTFDETVIVADRPVTIRGAGRGQTLWTSSTSTEFVVQVKNTEGPVVFEDLTLHGEYRRLRGLSTLQYREHPITLRRVEVKEFGLDCVHFRRAHEAVVEESQIHHCLLWDQGRRDAHGIFSDAIRLTVRDTDIGMVSGDAVQQSPNRTGWESLTIERSRLWTAPLAADTAGFQAGVVPGENALDTKVCFRAGCTQGRRPTVAIRDVVMHGWRGGLITNMAALNLKEAVDVEIDGVTIHDSEIAIRARGAGSLATPNLEQHARIRARNLRIHDVNVAVRAEDGIAVLDIDRMALGANVFAPFVRAPEARPNGLSVTNSVALGDRLPREMAGGSNRAVAAAAFEAAAASLGASLAAGGARTTSGLSTAAPAQTEAARPSARSDQRRPAAGRAAAPPDESRHTGTIRELTPGVFVVVLDPSDAGAAHLRALVDRRVGVVLRSEP